MSYHFLERTLFLATLADAQTAPNPKVGAVVVYNNEILAEGFHEKAGEPHAEVNAINQVADKSLLRNSRLYVSLEPCCFHGKTPACTDLIGKYQIPEVHILTKDPNPKVAGKGIQILEQAGIKTFLYENTSMAGKYKVLNRAFFYNQLERKSYLTLKWAEDIQGIIGSKKQRVIISDFASQALTHRLRANHQAILIGANTFLTDKPQLNVRFFPSKHTPLKIILDFFSVLKPSHFKNSTGKFLVLNRKIKEEHSNMLRFVVPKGIKETSEGWQWEELKQYFFQEHQISSIFIEGGAEVIRSLLAQNASNEILRFQNPEILKVPDKVQIHSRNFEQYRVVDYKKLQTSYFLRLIHEKTFNLLAKSASLWKEIY